MKNKKSSKLFSDTQLESLPYNYIYLNKNDIIEHDLDKIRKKNRKFRFEQINKINTNLFLIEPLYKSLSRLFEPKYEK